ncbi:unnamed protein product, partial [Callosobruchus maculatus]
YTYLTGLSYYTKESPNARFTKLRKLSFRTDVDNLNLRFRDLRKAVDIIMLKKLKYGFGTNIIKWFREYLINRFQDALVGERKSSNKESKHGAPQANDWSTIINQDHCKSTMYHVVIDGVDCVKSLPNSSGMMT